MDFFDQDPLGESVSRNPVPRQASASQFQRGAAAGTCELLGQQSQAATIKYQFTPHAVSTLSWQRDPPASQPHHPNPSPDPEPDSDSGWHSLAPWPGSGGDVDAGNARGCQGVPSVCGWVFRSALWAFF